MPANIAPKHFGHDAAVRCEPQYSHFTALGSDAGAPQVGQLSDEIIHSLSQHRFTCRGDRKQIIRATAAAHQL